MGISEEMKKGLQNRLNLSHRERRMGITKKKILLLLCGGLALGLSGSPRTSWKILGEMTKDWKKLSRQAAERAINSLYSSKLVATEENADGTFTLVLSAEGKNKALRYDLDRMKIKRPPQWDNLWRMVSFDIPESERDARDAIRGHLIRLGFYEQHQSFFVYPFDCRSEIEYLIELYGVRKYARFILATYIDNESHLKRFFSIPLHSSAV